MGFTRFRFILLGRKLILKLEGSFLLGFNNNYETVLPGLCFLLNELRTDLNGRSNGLLPLPSGSLKSGQETGYTSSSSYIEECDEYLIYSLRGPCYNLLIPMHNGWPLFLRSPVYF